MYICHLAVAKRSRKRRKRLNRSSGIILTIIEKESLTHKIRNVDLFSLEDIRIFFFFGVL